MLEGDKVMSGFKSKTIAIFLVLFCFGSSSAYASNLGFDFFKLFEKHGAVMLLIEAETGEIVQANEAAVVFYGYSKEALESMTIQDINTLTPEQVAIERMAAAAEKRNFFIFPHRLADGSIRTVEVFSYPFEMDGVTMLYSVIFDITEQLNNERLLQQKLRSLESAESIARLGHWTLNIETGMFTLSDTAMNILGLTESEVSALMMETLILPEYRTVRAEAFANLVEDGLPYNVTFRLRQPNTGSLKHVHSLAEFDANQNIVFGIIQDITLQTEQGLLVYRKRTIIINVMIAAIVGLTVFIIVLWQNIRKRKSAEDSLKEKLTWEQMLSILSSSFINSNSNNISEKLEDMLSLLGERFGAERCYITEFSENGKTMTMTHEWCKEGVQAHKQYFQKLKVEDYMWILKESQNERFIFIPEIAKLPDEAAAEREQFLSIGVEAILAVKIMIMDKNVAHLGFDFLKPAKEISDQGKSFLKILANIVADALEKCIMEKSLHNEKEKLRITISSVGDGIIATDSNGFIELMNPVAQTLTGWKESEALGKQFGEVFSIINEFTNEIIEDPVKKVLETGEIITLANHTLLIRKDGELIAIADSAAPIRDTRGEILGAVLVFRDVTEEKSNYKKIEYLSFHDQLTCLYNRHYFEVELKRIDNSRNLPLSLIVADLNGLKLVNDAFGHKTGDELIKAAADVLKSECREDEIITRIGGDEFVVLLPKTNLEQAEQIVKRIQKRAKGTFIGSVMLSMSMGWACKQTVEENFEEVFKQAEKYMYRRKLFESQSMRGATVNSIIRTLFKNSIVEEMHSARVSELSAKIGQAMGLNEESIEELKTLGMFHDIGKIAVSEQILNKTETLNHDERLEIRRHAEIGFHILSSVTGMAEVAEYVLAHHEKWDGTGYPRGLKGEQIPLQARIASVANAYDYILTNRPYKKAYTKEQAVEEIVKNSGTQFDPEVVKVFVESVVPFLDE